MVIYGEPGCGKTSVLCAAAKQCRIWINNGSKLPSIGIHRHARPSVVAANFHKKIQQPIIIFRYTFLPSRIIYIFIHYILAYNLHILGALE